MPFTVEHHSHYVTAQQYRKGKEVWEERELMCMFYCESGRAVKKGRDGVRIKDNTWGEYKSLPIVTSYSLLFVHVLTGLEKKCLMLPAMKN